MFTSDISLVYQVPFGEAASTAASAEAYCQHKAWHCIFQHYVILPQKYNFKVTFRQSVNETIHTRKKKKSPKHIQIHNNVT